MVRKWSYIKIKKLNTTSLNKWPISTYFKFKMFRSNTRFLKYKLTYTNFFRVKTILRLRRTTFKIYLSVVSVWVSLFQSSKHRYNFLQSYSMFSTSLYLPFINPILNNIIEVSKVLNHYPQTPILSVNKILSTSNLYLYKNLNGNTEKSKISKVKKILYSRFLLILQFPYDIINLLKIKNYNDLTHPMLLIKQSLLTLGINKAKELTQNFSRKNHEKNLINTLVRLVLYIISLYRKFTTHNVLRLTNRLNILYKK